MRLQLKPFSKAALNIELSANVETLNEKLNISFSIAGDLNQLKLEKLLSNSKRVIGLWESTCFEVFIKNSINNQYFEMNVSSNGNWNVFYFKEIKSKLEEYKCITHLRVIRKEDDNKIFIDFSLPLDLLPRSFWLSGKMIIGLSSILESSSGDRSYWSLKHPDKKPNFHHPESFVYTL